MKLVDGEFKMKRSVNDIPQALLTAIKDILDEGVSASLSAELEALFTSELTGIEPAFYWDRHCDGSDPQAITNPLALYFVLGSGGEEPMFFLTSLQEIFAERIRHVQKGNFDGTYFFEGGYFDKGLSMIAEGLRELADDIDATMITKRISPVEIVPPERPG